MDFYIKCNYLCDCVKNAFEERASIKALHLQYNIIYSMCREAGSRMLFNSLGCLDFDTWPMNGPSYNWSEGFQSH